MRLERRYRRLLRLLPAWYRSAREDEMVARFLAEDAARQHGLDASDHGVEEETEALRGEYGWPGWRTASSVAALAVRTRLGGVGAPDPARSWGDAVRLVGLLGLLAQAALAVVSVVSWLVVSQWGPAWVGEFAARVLVPTTWGDWQASGDLLLSLVWLPAYVSLARGSRRSARVCTAVAVLPSLLAVASAASSLSLLATTVLLEVSVWLPAVCVVLGFHRDAPCLSARIWLLALPAVVLGMGGVGLVAPLAPTSVAVAFGAGPEVWLLAVVALATLVVRLRAPARVPGSWSAALAGLTVPGVLATLAPRALTDSAGVPPVLSLVPLITLAFLGILLALVAARSAREQAQPQARRGS